MLKFLPVKLRGKGVENNLMWAFVDGLKSLDLDLFSQLTDWTSVTNKAQVSNLSQTSGYSNEDFAYGINL